MSEEQAVLEGLISIEAALKAGSRPLQKLRIRAGVIERDVARLAREAERQHIPVERVPADEIDRLANGKSHGGVIALVGGRRFVELEALVAEITRPFIVMLDG